MLRDPQHSTTRLRTIIVTGVSGFIGRYIARHFSERGWAVIGIDRAPPEKAPLASLSLYQSSRLPDPVLNALLKEHEPQSFIHCAGPASVDYSMTDPADDFYDGTVLTFEILDALRLNAPSCRFVFVSSAAVYGNPSHIPVSEDEVPSPISPYGFHKWQCELQCLEYARVFGLLTASVRIFSAYGPGLRRQVIWDICHKALTQDPISLRGTGKESRDFIHAQDIAVALMTVLTSAPMRGEVYNLGSGREVTIAELAGMVLTALECDTNLEFDGVVPSGTPRNWQADISKLGALGFTPSVSFEEAVEAFAKWCRADLLAL